MLRIGVDAVTISDMRRLLDVSPKLLPARGWTPREQFWCDGRADRYAARWAAKEATMKALGHGLDRIDPHEVEVVSTDGAAPDLLLHGEAAAVATAHGITRWAVSLTHDNDLALAFVIGYGTDE
ncbi:holo-ACP synthase [Curtobacterium luteum]|uniref:holo-ACP synthase n=1 Tax=Curtobacterium luteum TaxID=33881 RepID=UPI0038138F1C